GSGEIRSAASRFQRNRLDSVEHSYVANRDSFDLRFERRRIRDIHSRWADFLLEQLRRRWADGWTWQLHGSAYRPFHHSDARSGDTEIGRAARLSAAPTCARPTRWRLRPQRGGTWQASFR